MPFLASIEQEDKVPHVLAKFRNGTQRPLLDFHQALLRGDSEFSVTERELMAAYVSGINSCQYCYGAHGAVAKLYGISEQLIADMLIDPEQPELDKKLWPVLRYLKKLTLTPTKMVQADADAVFAVGWSEQALYDAVNVCCLYNFMNRFVEGLGLTPVPEQFDLEGKMITEGGYNGMLDEFGIR